MPIVEHSSGAILFDFYSAAEVVGAPHHLFLLYIFLLYVYNMFVYSPPYFLVGERKKYLFLFPTYV